MPFNYQRTVRFADTDAAGVVFFANYLAICHEAYEASLEAGGIELQTFFRKTDVVIPIARSEVEYLRPLFPGDKLRITVQPERLSENAFAIRYEVFRAGNVEKIAARARTEHVATSSSKRERVPLPGDILAWIARLGA